MFHYLVSPLSYHTLIFALMSSRNLYLYNGYILYIYSIDEPETPIFSVSKRNKESAFKHCHVIIDGKNDDQEVMTIDTGAKVSTINEDLYKRQFKDHQLTQAKHNLKAYNNGKMPVICVVTIPNVEYNNNQLDTFQFYVTKQDPASWVSTYLMLC